MFTSTSSGSASIRHRMVASFANYAETVLTAGNLGNLIDAKVIFQHALLLGLLAFCFPILCQDLGEPWKFGPNFSMFVFALGESCVSFRHVLARINVGMRSEQAGATSCVASMGRLTFGLRPIRPLNMVHGIRRVGCGPHIEGTYLSRAFGVPASCQLHRTISGEVRGEKMGW